MVRRAIFCAAVLFAAGIARADGSADWQRRVLSGSGTGAPDLNAPSIAAARKGAERAARTLAVQGALEALRSAELLAGGTAAQLLVTDPALLAAVEAKLRSGRPRRERYFVDGGVALDLELSLDALPPALLRALKPLAKGTVVPDPLDPEHLPADLASLAEALRALTPQQDGALLASEVTRRQGELSLTLQLTRPGKPPASVLLKGKNVASLRSSLEKALPKLFQ